MRFGCAKDRNGGSRAEIDGLSLNYKGEQPQARGCGKGGEMVVRGRCGRRCCCETSEGGEEVGCSANAAGAGTRLAAGESVRQITLDLSCCPTTSSAAASVGPQTNVQEAIKRQR